MTQIRKCRSNKTTQYTTHVYMLEIMVELKRTTT